MKRSLGLILAVSLLVAMGIGGLAAADVGVSPTQVHEQMLPGDSITITKTVTTPIIPPKPDVYFLADTTGSMYGAIANVQANAAGIMTAIQTADPSAQFGAGDYKDFPFDDYAFQNAAPIGGDVAGAIAAWYASGGYDGSEGWFYALYQLATDPGILWREGSTRMVVMFGDMPAHDPVPAAATGLGFDLTEQVVTDALVAAGIRVIAVSTWDWGLDYDPTWVGGDYAWYYGITEDGAAGQATRIAAATGGVHLSAATPDEVADTILAGLANLPVDVWWSVSADDGLSVGLSPDVHYAVTSGDHVTFEETIAIADDIVCGIFNAEVTFYVGTYPDQGEVVGTETIEAGDFIPPTVAVVEWVNPAGKKIPPAGSSTLPGTKGGMNDDGFYKLLAEDNCCPTPMIYVTYEGATEPPFGPFMSETVVKFTEAPGALPVCKKIGGPTSAVAWHITLPADAIVFAVDCAGNLSDPTIAYVPPLPK